MTLSMVPVHQQRKEGDCAFLLLGRDSDSVHLEYLLWCSITDTGVNALEVREVMEPITPPSATGSSTSRDSSVVSALKRSS